MRIDPQTGFRYSDARNKDAKQNIGYERHTDPAETTRDYSRPHTIPPDEFTEATGKDHAAACAEWAANQERAAKAAEEAAAAQAAK